MSLSPPLPLVLEVMEEAEADCALAFAEAQRWVEVSAFTPLLSARVGGLAAAPATLLSAASLTLACAAPQAGSLSSLGDFASSAPPMI